MSIIKSKQRIDDHGEVFTPSWLVDEMLKHVSEETERIDSRFLEPACGCGNFLTKILEKKLNAVENRFGKSEFDKRQFAFLSLMCVYGIEIQEDNVTECRAKMLEMFTSYINAPADDSISMVAQFILNKNIVQGDAMTMRSFDGTAITFSEWGYLGKGKFQRREFRFSSLTLMGDFGKENSLFSEVGKHEIFSPVATYPPMSIQDIAQNIRQNLEVNKK